MSLTRKQRDLIKSLIDPMEWYKEFLQEDVENMEHGEAQEEVLRLWIEGGRPAKLKDAWVEITELVRDNPDKSIMELFGPTEPEKPTLQFVVECPIPEGVALESVRRMIEDNLKHGSLPFTVRPK